MTLTGNEPFIFKGVIARMTIVVKKDRENIITYPSVTLALTGSKFASSVTRCNTSCNNVPVEPVVTEEEIW